MTFSIATRRHHRLLPTLCLIVLILGAFPPGGDCHRQSHRQSQNHGQSRGLGGRRDSSSSRGAQQQQQQQPQISQSRYRSNRLLPPDFEQKTEELVARLLEKKRRLQEDDNGGNVDGDGNANANAEDNVVEDNVEQSGTPRTPTNGCSICEANTFLPDKIPNQNILRIPPYTNATCQQWQDDILPTLYPNNEESCRSEWLYQLLFVSCCTLSVPRYRCETNVHNLLSGIEDYNTAVPPIVGNNDEPLIVTTDLIFNKAVDIDVMTGSATILVTVEMWWKDPRLTWTIDRDTNCVDYVDLWTGYNVQDTTIWVPDFDLLNQVQGIQEFSTSLARVSRDGIVSWKVFGSITATCAFKGLANIPFDTLGCQFLFGARSRSDANLIAYRFRTEESISLGYVETKYEEFQAVPELFEKGYTSYYNTDYATAMYYNFYFKRAENFYVVDIVIPALIFTYSSFGTFLLDIRIGERLGYGMALALVIIATQILTFDLVPVSSSKLWIDKFVAWSFYWVFFVLIQSVFVAFSHVLQQDRRAKRAAPEETEAAAEEADHTEEKEATAVPATDLETNTETATKYPGKESFFWTYSLRKFDLICLTFCILSYTLFVVFMFVSNYSGWWLLAEPRWETPTTLYLVEEIPNNGYNSSASEL
eukprot:jgi/Psemu1/264518/estExt_Genewise1Plus.C_18160005